MPIVSSSVTKTKHGNRYRARLSYTFADGTVINRGPNPVDSEAAADTLLTTLEPEVLLQKKDHDTSQQVADDGDVETTGDATPQQVARKYLNIGMNEADPHDAYFKLKKPLDYFVAQGWTPTQIKAQLLLTDAQWDAILARWTYLQLDPTTLQDYESIRQNDPGIGGL